jgi:hypothetical protein
MLIGGQWLLRDDGVVRPVVRANALAADGSWKSVAFLVDVGADRTVFSAPILTDLGVPPMAASRQLAGVGGAAPTVAIDTQIRLRREDGTGVLFRGTFAAFTLPESLDMSVLGRDITNLFAAIIDRPGDVVCLLGQRHRYTITESP